MKAKIIFIVTALLLTACGSSGNATPEVQPTEPAIVANTPPPTQANPPATNAATEETFFSRDDFDGTLASGWIWKNEDAENWNLSTEPGWLEIMVSPGHITSGAYSNLLLRPAPTGDFQLETAVKIVPVADFQFVGLIIYAADSDFIQAGRAYCDDPGTCIGEGLYLDNFVNSTFQPPNYGTPYNSGELIYLKLQRQGDTYTFFTSPDGSEWTEIGQQQNKMDPLFIGLIAAQNISTPIPALFDYFEVTEVE